MSRNPNSASGTARPWIAARSLIAAGSWIAALLLIASATALDARPITMSDAEQQALRSNLGLRVLRRQAAIRREVRREKLRAFFPSLSVSYRRNRTIARRNFDNGSYSVQVNLSQPIYNGGRSLLAYQIATIDLGSIRFQLRAMQSTVRLKVREAYLGLLQQKAAISIGEAALKSATHFFRLAVLQRRQGAITELDFRERLNQLEARRLGLAREREAYRSALRTFLIQLGLPPRGKTRVTWMDLAALRVAPLRQRAAVVYAAARRRHPELRQARIALARSRKEYLIARYDHLPAVSLTGRYGKSGDTWPPTTTEWGVGFSVTFRGLGSTLRTDGSSDRSRGDTARGYSAGGTLSVYDQAGYRQALLQSGSSLLQARRKQRDLQRSIRNQVHGLLSGLQHRTAVLRVSDEKLALLELRNKVDLLRFKSGELSYRDYLEAEERLLRARLDLVKERIQLAVSVNRMEAALGFRLDHFKLINWAEVAVPHHRAQEAFRRAWQPHTRIVIPGAGTRGDAPTEARSRETRRL